MELAQQIGECLHAYGVHSVTVQPEPVDFRAEPIELGTQTSVEGPAVHEDVSGEPESTLTRRLGCRVKCREGSCDEPQCCD